MRPTLETICVVGYGYWGPKLVRNFTHHCKVVVCDQSANARKMAQFDFPGIRTIEKYEDVLADKTIGAVAIATPVGLHYQMAYGALLAKKHVLVEKPLTESVATAYNLVTLAKELGLVLMCDHTFLYHPCIRYIKSMLHDLGSMDYMDSTRVNLGLFQPDVNVVWDLAVHDVSIALHLFPDRPKWVQAIGAAHGGAGHADIASLFLRYWSGMFVRINVSWISPVKLRSMIFGGSAKMLVYDDLNVPEPIKILDSGFLKNRAGTFDYRTGDTLAPKIRGGEALADMSSDFVSSINLEHEPLSSGAFGLEVVRVLEAAQKSIDNGGVEVKL